MPKPKRNKGAVPPNDGRKNNGGNSTKPKKISEPRSVPARKNKAKGDRTLKYIQKALKEEFGGTDGEYEFWKEVAKNSKKSFPDRNLIANQLEKRRPSSGGGSQAPVINFFTNQQPPPEQTVDVEHEEIDE